MRRTKKSSPRKSTSRIIGEGEMADLIRAFDWDSGPLGPIAKWSDTLVTTVNLLLASRHPMFLWWGPDLIQFYNDGYRPSIRDDKHPSAVGQRGTECWPEIWSIIGPQIQSVMTDGTSSWNRNQLVPINRNGKLEEVYWTYGYSPVRDRDGAIQGTLVVCSETTEQVLSERRLRALLSIDLASLKEDESPSSAQFLPFVQAAIRDLANDPRDIPFAAFYVLNQGQIASFETTARVGPLTHPGNWPVADALQSGTGILVEDLDRRVGPLCCEPWPEPVTRCYVLPLSAQRLAVQGVLAFGISPRLPFDDNYKTFFKVIASRIAGLLESHVQKLELAQAARRFRGLAQADPFGLVIGDLQGRLKYANPALRHRLGYTEAEFASGSVRWDVLTPKEHAAADARAVEQLRTRGHCDVYEKEYFTEDGNRIPILIGASILESTGGDTEVVAFVTDLTPLKMAEAELRRANDELERKVEERTAALESEIQERKRAEKSLRELTGRLLVTQDEERRHFARELHDHAGQTLSALGINLSMLQSAVEGQAPKITQLANDSLELTEALSTEIRTLSYLLHPPLLDEIGLASALRWYVDGFSERSKIQVEVNLPAEMERLPRELELVVFRIVQESLTNIHRHSESTTAKIHLTQANGRVEFEISDRGKGIPVDNQIEMARGKTGVGVRGMAERVRQFGGTFQISSNYQGTRVFISLPVESA
jgi:PAS domain S-box-containing protein